MSWKTNLPDWDDIPPVEGMPHGCAWAVWGKGDELGALNLLTPENTVQAAKEIRTGIRVQLDWRMDYPTHPPIGRIKLVHNVLHREGYNDDEVHFNTQSSSQWDGFKHIYHNPTNLLYNGLPLADVRSGKDPLTDGVHKWVEAGGLAGRGILLDWHRWYTTTNPSLTPPHPCTTGAISISDLEAIAKSQGTEFKTGDVLFVRTGFIKWHEEASDEERKAGVQGNKDGWLGVAYGDETKKWIWNHHFAAVVADNLPFEQSPSNDPLTCLHNWLLPLAGIPIGEMFNLEALSEACAREKRWSFFFTSAPLNVPGGVASGPNIIAIL